jgi:hypothetical protein
MPTAGRTGVIDTAEDLLEFVVLVGCASLNLAIHFLLSRRADRRRAHERGS